MALHSQFHMPGSFHADGVHPDIFHPPNTSPNSAGSPGPGYPASRSGATTDDYGQPKRKRFHDDVSTRIREPKAGNDAGLSPFGTPAFPKLSTGPYMLAGQLDSPTTGPVDSTEALGESTYSDSDYRRMLGTKRPRDDVDLGSGSSIFGAHPLAQQQQSPSQGWRSFAVTALGDVVGRIWQFCKAGTFKGFHAGGGRGYDLRPSVEDVSMLQDDFRDESLQQRVPGRYPQAAGEWPEKHCEVIYADSRASTPTAPAAKRRQTAATDDLGKNWVMVNNPNGSTPSRCGTPDGRLCRTPAPNNASPRNRNHSPSVVTGRRISTPAGRRSMAGRPSMASTPTVDEVRPASSASFASPRSSSPTKNIHPPASASFSTPKTHSVRRHRTSASFSTTPCHRRSHSGASAASNRASQNSNPDSSPRLDPEARKLAARRRRDDDDNDVRMTAFNQQLQDMIRQGKEALGTTVEVDGDGGWEDDESMS